jgi:glycosyltransferase involved in cell wall biosynthesis
MIPLIVDLETEWRGGQSQALLLLKGLYERGHAAELIAVKGSSLQHRARKEGIYVHTVSRKMMRLSAAAKTRSVMADGRIDLVHVNESHALTAAWLAGAHRKVPLLSSRRIGFPLQKNWISTARYRALARFVANSKAVAQTLLGSGISSDRVSIVNEGVEIPVLVPAKERELARRKWKIADDEYLFGCASAFVPEKGQRHIVEALKTVREKYPKARLLLAGEGKSLRDVNEMVERLGLKGAVVAPGFVTNMPEFYATLDAFVFPSEFEGLGTALQAAMSYGLPVISTSRGALGEVVDDGRTALVAEPNAKEFSAAMLRLMADGTLQRKLGAAGREEVILRFSADRMVDTTIALYEEVLSGKFSD